MPNDTNGIGAAITHVAPYPSDCVSFGELIHRHSLTHPSSIAVIVVAADGTAETLTWSALEQRSSQWGRLLRARGAAHGSLVTLAVPNSTDLVLSVLGCWKIGAVPVPMRWDLPPWERGRLTEVIGASTELNDINRTQLATEATELPTAPLPVDISPAINGICSSGSTGTPKVILNETPSAWDSRMNEPFVAHWNPDVPRPQRILVPGPMYHTNGFNALSYLLGGDMLVVLEKFSAAAVLDAIERHRITTFTATPTMLARIADHPDVESRDLSSIEWILQGAAVMPPTLLRRWFSLLHPERMVMAYGMTENLGLTALRGDEWLSHPESVGKGFRDTEIRILDDDQNPVPPGLLGEIYLRAPMSGRYRYLGNAEPLPKTRDGFQSAGDLGYLDADGYLYIADRRADMIVTGGANVFPAEVEAALSGHEQIADVVVIGLSDPAWGRRVHAVVQPAVGAELSAAQVIGFARGRLAPYKVPKTVEFLDVLPRTEATKINRSAMIAARGG